MYPHEKPGYVDACRKAGVCKSVVWPIGEEPVYCSENHTYWLSNHSGFREETGFFMTWYDDDCAPLEGGS